MTLQGRSNIVLAFTRLLYVNGQSTDDTLTAAERLGGYLGLRTHIIPRWGELQLEATDGTTQHFSIATASPDGVDMERVASATRAIDQIGAGQLAQVTAFETSTAIARTPPDPAWLFTIAAAAGAAALSVLFGIRHIVAVLVIVASAAAGAVLRRILGRYSTNPFLQPLCAALLAGIIGALAVRYQLSSSLRLVAVCPCMILVPGPHVLNGMMDVIAARISLGSARLVFAGVIVLAISCGLLFGLGLLGVSLPVGEPGRNVPLWIDVIAAGVAVAAYSVFYSTPVRMLPWPIAVGMAAHALRWWTLARGGGPATGAFVACLLVGLCLAPIAYRRQMPFAAVGFAAVVSMIPGVFLFRMASGLVQLANDSNASLQLLGATIADGMIAFTVILAMTLGVVVPKIVFDRLIDRAAQRKT
jgi:uncharacterized membrane protein YjjP (DUF1212 family)